MDLMKKNNSRKRKSKSGLMVVIATVLVLFVVITYNKINLEAKNAELHEQKVKYEQQLGKYEEEQKNIDAYKKYVKSDENVERIAREKLGLVYPGDVVFEPEED